MKYGISLSFLLVLGIYVFAQQSIADIPIYASYDSIPISKVIEDIEQKHKVRFFYQQEWVDSLFIDAAPNGQSLKSFLNEILSSYSLHFYIEDTRIILTKNYSIQPKPISQDFHQDLEESRADWEVFEEERDEASTSVLANIETQVFEIGMASQSSGKEKVSFAGYVKDIESGAPIAGVSVVISEASLGVITDDFGYYVILLPKGTHEVQYQYVGKQDTKRQIRLLGDGQLDVEMEEKIIALKEVVISGEKSEVESVQTGVAKLNIEEINSIPTVLGEADIMKISLLLPGVQSAGEGTAGFNVRGGATDQNLILLNDAVIYNPSHLFGFFSAFNPDVIKSANLYKSGLQSHFGGRVSSVFDVSIRDGNKKRFIAAGGISPITSKITLEGPIRNENSSFILGLRSTYSNWLLRLLDDPGLRNSNAYFGDVIGKINHQLNEKNNLQISSYYSQDRFKLNADTLYQYDNLNASLRWRHAINNQLYSLVSAGMSRYTYSIESKGSPTNAFQLGYKLSQTNLKAELDFRPNSNHQLKAGFQSVFYRLSPGQLEPVGQESFVKRLFLQREQGWENALFMGDEFTISARLSVYGGIRFSTFSLIGPGQSYEYLANSSKEVEFISDTLSFQSGAFIKNYGGPEYRFSLRYKLAQELSVKFSYDKTRQYIHRLSNTVAVSPTDTWRLSNMHIRPQIGDQFALGFYKNVPQKGLEFTIEGYYKIIQNLLEYKDGADLLINEALETDVINARGRAYGVEFLAKKKSGRFNGWISYTYARSLVQAKSVFPQEQINGGQYFPSNFDKPHNLSIVSNYKFSRRVNLSFTFVYSTGRPITLPITKYEFSGNVLAFFSDRNAYRIPDYLRMDVALNLEGSHKVKKLGHSSWSLSIYNLTGRNNAYSVFSRNDNGNINLYQLSIFSRPIPTITYNFEIR